MIVNKVLYPQAVQYKLKKRNNCNNERRKSLIKNYDLEPKYAKQFASLDDEHYKRVVNLAEFGFNDTMISVLSDQKPKDYKKILKLIKLGFSDDDLTKIIKLDKKQFKRLIRLEKNGIAFTSLFDFLNLPEEQLKESVKLIKQGCYPMIAANLVKFNLPQRNTILQLLEDNIEIDDAVSIVSMDEKNKIKYDNFRQKGINPCNSIILASMNNCHEDRIDDLLSKNIDEDVITDFADMSDEEYQQALSLLHSGVYPDYIKDIILLNNSKIKNRRFERNVNRGYSPTSSFALAQFDNAQLKAFKELIKINPQIKTLLYDNYDIILLTQQDTDIVQAILTKQIYTPEGTKITLTQTFDENGNTVKSKTEEYNDHSTSSRLESNSDIYKTKYDKFGQIKELVQYIKDKQTNGIKGVLHYKASEVLKGAYDCTYYDIDKFYTDSESSDKINFDLKNSVKDKGITLSAANMNADGSISYDEKFTYNNYTTQRHYQEKKDDNGFIEYNKYNYTITDDKGEKILDTEREFIRDKSGKIINKINGIEYKINFDDKHKTIKITDGNNIKTINTVDKLSYYSKEPIWNCLKNLQADTLLTIFKNIHIWDLCENSYSEVFYTKNQNNASKGNKDYLIKLITSENPQTIMHECGHIKCYEEGDILDDEILLRYYSEEMNDFEKKIPYNEQEFVRYFMPNAKLYDAQGLSEFVAESNIILSAYGDSSPESSTRSQLLIRFFPKTIARAAELLGKNSRKSILANFQQ